MASASASHDPWNDEEDVADPWEDAPAVDPWADSDDEGLDTDPSIDLHDTGPEIAAQNLIDYLLYLKRSASRMTANHVCIIAHWASLAGEMDLGGM